VWREIITTARGQQRVLVAEESMEICGYARFGPSLGSDQNAMTMGEVYSIYVAPERWRQHIGGKLLVESMKALGRAGFDACTLWVLVANDPARRFYERYRWRLEGAEKLADQEVMEVRYRMDGLVAQDACGFRRT
jgi:ribosomal protein S18 acetylase RimI-like enzyme